MPINQVSTGSVCVCVCVCVCNYTSTADSLMKMINAEKKLKFTCNPIVVNILEGSYLQKMRLCLTNSIVTGFFLPL
jgi:hypothetical protein